VKVTIWTVGLAPREKVTKSIVAVACLMHHFRDEMHFKNFNHSMLIYLFLFILSSQPIYENI